MCQNPSMAWAMIQTMRSIAREGGLSANGQQALRQHRLDALAVFLPPLVELVQAWCRQEKALETSVEALPTPVERGLLNATACALRDPERSRELLAQWLAPAGARRAEDIVAAMACALEDQCCQRQRRAHAVFQQERRQLH